MTEKQIRLLKGRNLNPENWIVIWEDKHVLEIKNRRGRRICIDKMKGKNDGN